MAILARTAALAGLLAAVGGLHGGAPADAARGPVYRTLTVSYEIAGQATVTYAGGLVNGEVSSEWSTTTTVTQVWRRRRGRVYFAKGTKESTGSLRQTGKLTDQNGAPVKPRCADGSFSKTETKRERLESPLPPIRRGEPVRVVSLVSISGPCALDHSPGAAHDETFCFWSCEFPAGRFERSGAEALEEHRGVYPHESTTSFHASLRISDSRRKVKVTNTYPDDF